MQNATARVGMASCLVIREKIFAVKSNLHDSTRKQQLLVPVYIKNTLELSTQTVAESIRILFWAVQSLRPPRPAGKEFKMADKEAATSTQPSAAAEVSPRMQEPRLMIAKIVCENFKSYAGVKELGPFHKVGGGRTLLGNDCYFTYLSVIETISTD